MRPASLLLATAFALTLAACKPDAAIKKSEVIGRGTLPNDPAPGASAPMQETPAGPSGTIAGAIFFSGKPPAPVRIDTSMDPACAMGATGAKDVFAEQYVVTAGKLANVFVYVKSGPPALTASVGNSEPTVLDQQGCQYTPHVIAVMRGGFVEFRNADPTMHNIHTMPTAIGNETVDITQSPRGAAVTKRFDKPELMMPVRCNNHPWMNAFINVSATPFFAVTTANGSFTLSGLPPGDYLLGAVHEKLGEKTISVTVKPNMTAKADVSFAAGK